MSVLRMLRVLSAGLLLAAVSLTTVTPMVVASTPVVRIVPEVVTLQPGESTDVAVEIRTDVALRGASGGLTFDPAVVRVEAVAEGAFFSDWAKSKGLSTLWFPQPLIDVSRGVVTDLGVSVLGSPEAGGATGTGTLATYRVTALPGVSGQSALRLTSVVLSDTSFRSIRSVEGGVSVQHGSVQVGEGAPQVNVTVGATPITTAGANPVAMRTEGSGQGDGWVLVAGVGGLALVAVVVGVVILRAK